MSANPQRPFDPLDIDRRLDALVQVAASQSQSIHELAVSIEQQGAHLKEHTRQLEEHTRQLEEHTRQLQQQAYLVGSNARHLEELARIQEEQSRQFERFIDAFLAMGSDVFQHGRTLKEIDDRLTALEQRGPGPSPE